MDRKRVKKFHHMWVNRKRVKLEQHMWDTCEHNVMWATCGPHVDSVWFFRRGNYGKNFTKSLRCHLLYGIENALTGLYLRVRNQFELQYDLATRDCNGFMEWHIDCFVVIIIAYIRHYPTRCEIGAFPPSSEILSVSLSQQRQHCISGQMHKADPYLQALLAEPACLQSLFAFRACEQSVHAQSCCRRQLVECCRVTS